MHLKKNFAHLLLSDTQIEIQEKPVGSYTAIKF